MNLLNVTDSKYSKISNKVKSFDIFKAENLLQFVYYIMQKEKGKEKRKRKRILGIKTGLGTC